MAAFSFTAPRFTSEMMEAERNNLTEEEKTKINAECYGLDTIEIKETPEMVEQALKDFAAQLAAIEHKEVYEHALEHCPKLVETESAPIRFLRAEHFDAEAAAKRLVAYWDLRKLAFGDDKAFLPMRLEKGALGPLEMKVIREAPEIYMVLPKPDEHGRAILYSDKAAFDFTKYNRMVVTRVLWYVLHVALEKEEVQKKGFVAVALMGVTHLNQMDRRQFVLFFRSVTKALPMRWCAAHISRTPSFFAIVWPILAFIMGKEARQRCFVHTGSKHHILHELGTTFGIPQERLPRSLGGTLLVPTDEYIQTRKAIESRRFD